MNEKQYKQFLERQKKQREKQYQKRKEKIEYYKEHPEEKPKLKKFSKKMQEMHLKDKEFYRKIWVSRPHYCKNCGIYLGKDFEDQQGYVLNIYRYAHIIPKSTFPYLRHYEGNIILLCFNCHSKFDNSPKEIYTKMKCYNEKKIQNLKSLHKKLQDSNDEKYK